MRALGALRKFLARVAGILLTAIAVIPLANGFTDFAVAALHR